MRNGLSGNVSPNQRQWEAQTWPIARGENTSSKQAIGEKLSQRRTVERKTLRHIVEQLCQ